MSSNVSEEWRPIPGLSAYLVSNHGRVKHLNKQKVRALSHDGKGYLMISLPDGNGNRKHCRVHNLVASTFIGPRPAGAVVNHKDGVKTNNHVENLEYVSPRRNLSHAYQNGLRPTKLSNEDVRRIKQCKKILGVEELSRAFCVSRLTIQNVVNGVTHKHIK